MRLLATVLVLLCVVGEVQGQDQVQDQERYSLVLRGVSLDAALHQLVGLTHLDLSFEPALVEGKRTYCVAHDATPDELLACVLQDTGLDYFTLSSGMFVLTEAAQAPPRYGTLTGLVVDAASGEPLPFAHVYLAGTRRGTMTNEDGRFALAELLPGPYRLRVSYIGYTQRQDSVWVPPDGQVRQTIRLVTSPIVVAPIVIDGLEARWPVNALGASRSTDEELPTPSPGGTGVLPALTSLMGVHVNDATADVHVQGGKSGDHQFQLDGVPLFLPQGLSGIIGPLSPFAIGRVTVHKAGFGAPVGSQLSGVIQVDHALTSPDGRVLDVQVDAMSVNARGNLQVGRMNQGSDVEASVMAAARLDLWGLYTSPAILSLLEDWNRTDPLLLAAFGLPDYDPEDARDIFSEQVYSTGNPSLGFHDLHTAARVRFGPLHSLYLSGYWGERGLDSDRNPFAPSSSDTSDAGPPAPSFFRDYYTWESSASQARFESVLSARLLASLQLRYSHYALRHDYGSDREQARLATEQQDDQNRVGELGMLLKADYVASDQVSLEVGLEPAYTRSRFVIWGTQRIPIDHATSAWRVGSFIESTLRPSASTTIELGTRLTYLQARRTVFAEPRVAVRYDQRESRLGPWALRIGAGLYRQFVSQFDVSSRSPRALLSSNRVWLAADSTVSPPKASHFSAELLLQPAPSWTIRMEGYLKHLLHLLSVNYAARPNAGRDVETRSERFPQRTFLRSGTGYAHGAALQIEKRFRTLRLEGRYEYSVAERSVHALYRGDFDPVPWNEPHQLYLKADWTPHPRVTLLARWHSIWNRRWGFRQAYYDFFGANDALPDDMPPAVAEQIQRHVEAYSLGEPSRHELPPLHQLDLSAAYSIPIGAAVLQLRLDLLNVLGRANVADWRLAPDDDPADQPQLLQRDERLLLPFTPAFAVRLSR